MPDINLVYIKGQRHHFNRPASLIGLQQHPTQAKLCLGLSLLFFLLYISPNQGQFLFLLTLFEASYLMSLCIECVMRIDGCCCATFFPKLEDVATLLNNV